MEYANYIGINVNCLMKYHKTLNRIHQKHKVKYHKNTQQNATKILNVMIVLEIRRRNFLCLKT